MKIQYTIGIDEVGRGPLAGPVGVGVACVPTGFDWKVIPGVTDSKKLSAARREAIFATARQLQAAGRLRYEVSMVSAAVIDRIGIVPAVNLAMDRALKRLETKHKTPSVNRGSLLSECCIKLDGGLRAPERYTKQETIVRGDAQEPTIALASIVAKVTRDQYMCRLAQQAGYQPYSFQTHKGYGTVAHRTAILEYGLSTQHRASFCRNCCAS